MKRKTSSPKTAFQIKTQERKAKIYGLALNLLFAEGWQVHPQNAAFMYKGADTKANTVLIDEKVIAVLEVENERVSAKTSGTLTKQQLLVLRALATAYDTDLGLAEYVFKLRGNMAVGKELVERGLAKSIKEDLGNPSYCITVAGFKLLTKLDNEADAKKPTGTYGYEKAIEVKMEKLDIVVERPKLTAVQIKALEVLQHAHDLNCQRRRGHSRVPVRAGGTTQKNRKTKKYPWTLHVNRKTAESLTKYGFAQGGMYKAEFIITPAGIQFLLMRNTK